MQLEVKHISKAYGSEQVLSDVSFRIESGSTLAILGPSGCGKTTLMRIIAGFTSPQGGDVLVGGASMVDVPVEKRGIVYLSQQALLFPHLTVRENIAFGLQLRDLDRDEVQHRVEKMLTALELTEHGAKATHQLSGGQKQRVAFGRAIVIDPAVILLDEPFGSLDTDTRALMQDLYASLASQLNITAVFVTHDLKEALRMGSTLATLREGHLSVYDSTESFVLDRATGIQEEIHFWKHLHEDSFITDSSNDD